MAQVHFTSWLRELVPDGPFRVEGGTVGTALSEIFAQRPHVRGYVLDEHGHLRKHVCVFADGVRLKNDVALGHAVGATSKVYVMQALSGG